MIGDVWSPKNAYEYGNLLSLSKRPTANKPTKMRCFDDPSEMSGGRQWWSPIIYHLLLAWSRTMVFCLSVLWTTAWMLLSLVFFKSPRIRPNAWIPFWLVINKCAKKRYLWFFVSMRESEQLTSSAELVNKTSSSLVESVPWTLFKTQW